MLPGINEYSYSHANLTRFALDRRQAGSWKIPPKCYFEFSFPSQPFSFASRDACADPQNEFFAKLKNRQDSIGRGSFHGREKILSKFDTGKSPPTERPFYINIQLINQRSCVPHCIWFLVCVCVYTKR